MTFIHSYQQKWAEVKLFGYFKKKNPGWVPDPLHLLPSSTPHVEPRTSGTYTYLHLQLSISLLLLDCSACCLTAANVRGLATYFSSATTVQTCVHSGWSARSFCSKYLQERRGNLNNCKCTVHRNNFNLVSIHIVS